MTERSACANWPTHGLDCKLGTATATPVCDGTKFRSVYDSFAGYRATIIRLEGLVDANARALYGLN